MAPAGGGHVRRASVVPRKKRETGVQDAWVDKVNADLDEDQKTNGSHLRTMDEYLSNLKDEITSSSCFDSCLGRPGLKDEAAVAEAPPLVYPHPEGGCPLFHPDSRELQVFEQVVVAIAIYCCLLTPVEVAWDFGGSTGTTMQARAPCLLSALTTVL